ncbi:uncharacterized protein O9250_013409 [Rhynochetos jubatus]
MEAVQTVAAGTRALCRSRRKQPRARRRHLPRHAGPRWLSCCEERRGQSSVKASGHFTLKKVPSQTERPHQDIPTSRSLRTPLGKPPLKTPCQIQYSSVGWLWEDSTFLRSKGTGSDQKKLWVSASSLSIRWAGSNTSSLWMRSSAQGSGVGFQAILPVALLAPGEIQLLVQLVFIHVWPNLRCDRSVPMCGCARQVSSTVFVSIGVWTPVHLGTGNPPLCGCVYGQPLGEEKAAAAGMPEVQKNRRQADCRFLSSHMWHVKGGSYGPPPRPEPSGAVIFCS